MAYLNEVPKYAFGTTHDWNKVDNFRHLVLHAIQMGVRHFDCAPLYKTQPLLGDILSELPHLSRKEFFLTSKLPVNMMGSDELIERSLTQTLQELQTSYLDLFLIHAPFATQYISDHDIYPLDNNGYLMADEREGLLEDAWRKLVDLKNKGYVRFVGFSNLNLEQLERLNKIHQIDVVQNEYHLFNQDREFFDYCEEIDVHYEAYAAFGSPERAMLDKKPTFFTDPVVERVSKFSNITKPQVIIQWLHQQPLSYVIRTNSIYELEENIRATKRIVLSINDMIDLDGLNKNLRIYKYDNLKGLTMHKEYPFKTRPPTLHQHAQFSNNH